MSGLTQSAARRFLLTLLHERYLQTDGRYYWLTPKTLRLGRAYVDSAQFPRMVRPIVEYIASRTEEHASVGWWMKMNWSISPAVGIRRSTLRRCGLGAGAHFLYRRGDCGWLRCRKQSETVLQRITREQRTPIR